MSFIRKIKKKDGIYLAEVESKWIDGKVVQKHIRYIGKEVDNKTILSSSISNIQIEDVKIYGPILVLNYISKKINLNKILGEYGNEILCLVFAHCINYKSINQMSAWFKRTDLNVLLKINNLTERKLLQALDSLEAFDAVKLQQKIFNSVRKEYQIKPEGIIYDVTNTYLYGKKCPFGKMGHDKEGVKGRPLIQIGLGVTKDEGIPIFHKTFDGNIHDTKTLHDLISSFGYYGIQRGIVIYDRGITSAQNVADIGKLQWNSLCGVPLKGNLKSFIRKMKTNKNIMDIKNRVKMKKSIFYVIQEQYTIGKITGTLVLCFNEQQRKDLRESRYDEIINAQNILKRGKCIKQRLEKYFDKECEIIEKKLKEAEEFDGYSCIFTTASLSKEEIISLYFRQKDLVEKAFRTMKGITSLRPIRHWLYNRVTAHVFICYLAYLLLSLLNLHLKKLNISPELALREIDSMYKVYMHDVEKGFEISRVVTLSKKQNQILNAISRTLTKPSV